MTTSMRRARELVRGLLALLALGLMVVGIPVALLLLPGLNVGTLSISRLTGPDDGTLFLAAVVAIAWAGWLVLVACVLLEILSLLRGLPAPRVPALGSAQQTVAGLVAAVTLLMSGSGGAAQLVVKPMGSVATAVAAPSVVPRVVAAVESAPEMPHVSVQRHDTLWSLAERHLGSGERWQQIFDLNRGVQQPDGRRLDSARWIYPGWRLRLPADATLVNGLHEERHVVEIGETLSGIAQQELGTAAGTSALFAANRGRAQRVGGALDNPDVIRPGWELVVPAARAAMRPQVRPHHQPSTSAHAPVVPVAPAGPSSPPESPAPSSRPGPGTVEDPGDQPITLGLAGLGLSALTATGLLVELRRRRRMQQRSRTSGDRIRMPEPAVADVERRAAAVESPQSIAMTRTALRAVAQSCIEGGRPLPDVLLVRVGAHGLRLELATDDTAAVPPFDATSPRMWTLATDPVPAEIEDPFPALVALGSDGDEMVLLNLEAVGALHLDDIEGDLRRALVADLAVGPFAANAPLSFVNCFRDLPEALDIGRARIIPTIEQAAHEAAVRVSQQATDLAAIGDVRTARTASTSGELLLPEVYVAGESLTPAPAPWSGVCVIDQSSGQEGWSLTVEPSGPARLEPLGLDLTPQRLGEQDLARMLDVLRSAVSEVHGAPPRTPDETCLAAAEALREVPSVVLDLRPGVPAPPRVLLLGRVDVQNAIDEAAPHRRRRATELVSYLALHPGASGGELDEALWPGRRVEKTTRNPFVSRARQWLGRTADGEPYLPSVIEGGSYRLRPEVTCDWHDFVRLAKVGLKTQPPDASALAAALVLVRGRPFLGVDPTTYTWSDSDAQEMISAIVDVAHALAVLRLEAGDARGAREAAAKGLLAEPCSEMLFQDSINAAKATGDRAEVDRLAARLQYEIELIDPDGSLDDETLTLLAGSNPSVAGEAEVASPLARVVSA